MIMETNSEIMEQDAYRKQIEHINGLIQEALEINGSREPSYAESFAKAVSLCDEAMKIAEGIDLELSDYAQLFHGYTKVLLGQYPFSRKSEECAEEFLLKDLSLFQETYGPMHMKTGEVHRSIAQFYDSAERIDEAMPHYFKAITIFKDSNGEYTYEAGEVWQNVAIVYLRQNQLQKSVDAYINAYDISLNFPDTERLNTRELCFQIHTLYDRMGNRAKADEYLRKIAEYYG